MSHRVGGLAATIVKPEDSSLETAPPVVLVHGMGMGRWCFARFQAELLAQGVPSIAIDLPGHGESDDLPCDLTVMIESLTEVVQQVPGCSLLAHSTGGLVAQIVASMVEVNCLVLISPLGKPQLPPKPYAQLRKLVRRGLRLTNHSQIDPIGGDLDAAGLDLAPSDVAAETKERMTECPPHLFKEVMSYKDLDYAAILCPILITTGLKDSVLTWRAGRDLGELLYAIIWRYDDLGHFPMFQVEGARLEQQVTEFILSPASRKVTEADAWAPHEGSGLEARKEAAGDEGRRRSSYGQRMGRQGEDSIGRWDQNIK